MRGGRLREVVTHGGLTVIQNRGMARGGGGGAGAPKLLVTHLLLDKYCFTSL